VAVRVPRHAGARQPALGRRGVRARVCVAEDSLQDRGVWYYESTRALKASGYRGAVELLESEGQGHVFHYGDPARVLHACVLSFLRDQ
jgi:hypothetical protein